MRFQYEIDLQKIYLQEFTTATHLLVILNSNTSYSYKFIKIERKCKISVSQFTLPLDSQYQSIEFQVLKNTQILTSQICSGSTITDLFRCPVTITVTKSQEEILTLYDRFLHINIPKIVKFESFSYEASTDGITYCGAATKHQTYKKSTSIFIETELPQQCTFKLIGEIFDLKFVLFQTDLAASGYCLSQDWILENEQIEAIHQIEQNSAQDTSRFYQQLLHFWPIHHQIWQIQSTTKYTSKAHPAVNFGSGFLASYTSEFDFEQDAKASFYLKKVTFGGEETAYFAASNLWKQFDVFVSQEKLSGNGQFEQLDVAKIDVFACGQLISVDVCGQTEKIFSVEVGQFSFEFQQESVQILIEDESVEISEEVVDEIGVNQAVQEDNNFNTIQIENSSIIPFEIDVIPYNDQGWFTEEDVLQLESKVRQQEFKLKLYNKAHDTVKINRLKQDVLIFTQLDIQYFQTKYLPISMDSIILQKIVADGPQSQIQTFSSSDLISVLRVFTEGQKIEIIRKMSQKLERKYYAELNIVEQEIIIQKLVKLVEKLKKRKRESQAAQLSNNKAIVIQTVLDKEIELSMRKIKQLEEESEY